MGGRRLQSAAARRQAAALSASPLSTGATGLTGSPASSSRKTPADAPRGTVIGGIDPGTRQVGYALLQPSGRGYIVLACGSIACGSGPMAGRLARIAVELEALFAEHRPAVVGIETTYFGRSPAAAIKMGQGRGVAMAMAARSGADVIELAPRAIKQAVTGFGGAEKDQVARMAVQLLGLSRLPKSRDASDALGCALAVALQLNRHAVLSTEPRAVRAAPAPGGQPGSRRPRKPPPATAVPGASRPPAAGAASEPSRPGRRLNRRANGV